MADRSRTPTREDLAKLPRWACVAFAVRCARRAQPLFGHWEDAAGAQHDAVAEAITIAEAAARTGVAVPSTGHTRSVSRTVIRAIQDADDYGARGVGIGAAAAHSAARASSAALDAAKAADRSGAAFAAAIAALAVADAVDSGVDAYGDAEFINTEIFAYSENIQSATWADYGRLLQMSLSERWADKTPVDPDRLGPLWPRKEAISQQQDRGQTPAAKDLQRLPHWARVAFAARCARRVLPLLKLWPEAINTHVNVLLNAVDIIYRAAATGKPDIPLIVVASTDSAHAFELSKATGNQTVVSAARTVLEAIQTVTASEQSGSHTAHAAGVSAADALAQRAEYSLSPEIEDDAMQSAAEFAYAQVGSELWKDYDALLTLAKEEHWTSDTPVDPDRLGPIEPARREMSPPAPPALLLTRSSPPTTVIVRDMDVLTDEEYRTLISALADLAEASGAMGIRRLVEGGCNAPVPEVAL